MSALQSMTRHWNPLWLVAIGLAALVALAVTTGSSEASDEFGDDTGATTGTVTNPENAVDADLLTKAVIEPSSSLVVIFDDNVAYDGPGADITLHFDNDGDPLTGTVEFSQNGVDFDWSVALSDVADETFDVGALLSPPPFVTAVRITADGGVGDLDLVEVEATNNVPEEATVELSPPEAINDINETHDLTMTVAAEGTPIPEVELSWQITAGPSANGLATVSTDMNGQAIESWTSTSAGIDEIVAFLDYNGNGTLDEGEPSGTATKRWLGVTGTIDLIDIDGPVVALGDVLTVRVVDSDLDLTDGLDTVEVDVSSEAGPGFVLLLTETDVHSGIFEASIFLAGSTDEGASELAAAVGQKVSAEYDDELDDAGADPEPVMAELTVEAETDDAGDKVTLCHVPGGNPSNQHEISVGAPARLAHLAHGDSLGPCGAVDVDDGHPKQDFCEKRDDHPRCEPEQDQLELQASDSDGEAAEDAGKPSRAEAFCERRPDHRKCAEIGAAASSVGGDADKEDDEDDGDDGEADGDD